MKLFFAISLLLLLLGLSGEPRVDLIELLFELWQLLQLVPRFSLLLSSRL
jgi:hypothetical protein